MMASFTSSVISNIPSGSPSNTSVPKNGKQQINNTKKHECKVYILLLTVKQQKHDDTTYQHYTQLYQVETHQELVVVYFLYALSMCHYRYVHLVLFLH